MVYDLDSEAIAILQAHLHDAVSSTQNVPGAVICIVNQEGRLLFCDAAGKAGVQSERKMTVDHVFWLAGLLTFDNADQLEELLPPLRDVKVLEESEDGHLYLREKQSRITLRMLLSHTAGFGYSPYSRILRDWIVQSKSHVLDFAQPLIAQPGEDCNYGFNMEWVSLLIEKVSGLRINEYFQQHIFNPLDLKAMTLFPDEYTKMDLLPAMAHRALDGTLKDGPHFMQATLDISTPEAQNKIFQKGAGGCFGSASDYCAIIATLLNDGTSPTTKSTILQPSTVKQMFQNQIPQFPNFARKGIPAAEPEDTFPIPEIYPAQPHDQPQGWGLSFMLTLHPTAQGRGSDTANWASMANCYWWADRYHGVGGFIGTQIVPFFEPNVLQLCQQTENSVYSGRRGRP
ncbi:hypothetical protein BDV12DRAFT_189479 [Aspergillus spectabilis]